MTRTPTETNTPMNTITPRPTRAPTPSPKGVGESCENDCAALTLGRFESNAKEPRYSFESAIILHMG